MNQLEARCRETCFFPRSLSGERPARISRRRSTAAVRAVAVGDYRQCARGEGARSRRRFAAIEAWSSSDETGWPFSFVDICATLDLDLSAIRDGVRASQRSGRAGYRSSDLPRG